MYELMGVACYNTEKVLYEFFKKMGLLLVVQLRMAIYFMIMKRIILVWTSDESCLFLESNQAIFPRVIIDPEYAEKLFEFNENKYRSNNEQKNV